MAIDPDILKLAEQLSAIGNRLWHPDTHRPFTQFSEAETLHIVGVYTNPFRWRKRRELANDCIRHLRSAANVVLHVVELAYGDRPFEVTGEHPNDVQVRTTDELWHKENLINVGIAHCPSTWKYGGYCDLDFHFTRHDWALEAIHLLQHHEFVQLFSSYADLSPETPHSTDGHRPYRMNSTFAWNYLHQAEFQARKMNHCGTDPYYGLPIPQAAGVFPFGFAPGAPGGAWAWRRSAFDIVGGMLDTCILGSGDWHMAFGLIDGISSRLETEFTGRAYNESIQAWQNRARLLTRNIGCVDNFAVHHFHGSHRQRGYGDRWQIIVEHDLNPVRDLARDWQGVWRWAGNKPLLRDDVRAYFINRAEDSTEMPHEPLV